jgi:5-methylcytosine-specific restriction endonuclease McrA
MSIFKKIDKYCEVCSKKLILNNNRDIERKKFCSRRCLGLKTGEKLKEIPNFFIDLAKLSNNEEVNKKKGHPGSLHHNWLKDRSKVKAKRLYSEEKKFMCEIIKERNYTCEVTGELGGKLSVHHLNGVSTNKDRIFDRTNVIVVKKDIHLRFHKLYGTRYVTEEMWYDFIEKKEYL